MTLSEAIADFVVGTSYDDLPGPVVARAKDLVLDTLAVAWAGTESSGSDDMFAMVTEEGGRADATIWGFGARAPAAGAAFVNGVTSAALDYDSLHLSAMSHAAIVTLPVAFALAERERLSGREFLTAFALGYEVLCRLGLSTREFSGWFYTSIHGAFGGAVAGAKALRCDRAGVVNALGAALSHVGGTQQAIIEKSLTKRMQSAFAARNAVFCAQLGKRGVVAPREAFEGKFGFYAKYEKGDPAVVLDALGSRWELLATMFKKFPSCGCNHAAIEAALELRSGRSIAVGDIEHVEAVISPFMARLVAAPYNPVGNPQIAAQFSVQYSVASALMRGRLGVLEILPAAALDESVRAFAHRVRVVVDESKTDAAVMSAVVRIRLRSGETVEREVVALPGTPENPLSAADLQAKFAECTALGVSPLSPTQAAAMSARVQAIEDVPDMSRFFSGMVGANATTQRLA
jgi:2-methylcitrate dehydratase PrpD